MNKYLLAFCLAVLVVALDQGSKAWVLATFAAPDAPLRIELLPVLDLTLAWNRGMSFGLFQGLAQLMPLIWVILAAAICFGLLRWLAATEERGSVVAIGLIVGGALGNVVDRLRFAAVVDFIDAHWGDVHFWVFNVADAAISLGVMLIVAWSLFAGRRDPPARVSGA